MNVLVTNDDGVNALGIKILVEKLKKHVDNIYVVAPSSERSATSHSLTIKQGLELKKLEDIIPGVDTYSLSGSPADCVVFALKELKLDFDVVVSGVNKGYNLGDDIIYSGTFAAAQEALMKGKRGIAFSCKYDSFEGMKYFDMAFEYILKNDLLKEKAVINVNLPKDAKGIKLTYQQSSNYDISFIKKEDGLYYTECTVNDESQDIQNGDIDTIKSNYISISLLTFNYTDWDLFKKYH